MRTTGYTVGSLREYGNWKASEKNFTSFPIYFKYAEYLGVTWRELFDGIIRQWDQKEPVRPQYRRAWPDEKDVVEQVQKAIRQLREAGRTVTLGAISQETKMAKAYLRRYPLVKALLEKVSEELHSKRHERKNRQDHELFLAAQEVLPQLEFFGEIVSQRTLAQKLGVSTGCIRRNPLIIALLVESRKRARSDRRKRDQEETAERVQVAMQELEEAGQSINKNAIAKKLGISVASLDGNPSVVKMIDRSKLKEKRRNQREEELLTKVWTAIEQLATYGKRVTYRAIAETVEVNSRALKTYPRVKTLIDQYLCSFSLKMREVSVRQMENDVLELVKEAIQQFNADKQELTLFAICNAVGISLVTLKTYPRVLTLLDQCINERYQNMKKQGQIHEDELRQNVEQAVRDLEARGEIVTRVAIAELLGVDPRSLTHYLSVEMFLQQYRANNPRASQRENQLMEKAKATIQLLERSGQPISLKIFCRMIGCDRNELRAYPKVDSLLQQSIKNKQSLHKQQTQLKIQEELDKIKAAIQQLEDLGQPVTRRAISKIIGKSPKGFYYYPDIIAFLKKEIKEKSYRDKVRQKQQREYTLVELVLEARKRLQVLGIPFTGRALAQQTGVSYDTLQRYPRVRELLQQFRQECSQTKQR